MNTKLKSKISFDKQASIYDVTDFSKYSRECYPYVMEAIKDIKFKKVLDLGCGTGVILEQIKESYNETELYGLDLSKNMIIQAQQRLGPKAKLSIGDAESLPYENDSFDLICCIQSFHHYPNPYKAILEMKRVLKKGGTLLLCDTWIRSPIREIMNFFIKFSNEGDVHIYSEGEIVKLLTEAGLKSISWDQVTKRSYICIGHVR